MNALVTGAGGFLGRHVVARLRALSIPLETLGRSGSIPLADPGDAMAIRAGMQAVRPSLVFHLAGTSAAEPLEDAYRINVLFGVHILDAARDLPVPPRVLLAGSAAEYGPVVEELLPLSEQAYCKPRSAYGITKLAQTLHGVAAASAGLSVVVARLFNVVGSGMPVHLALGAFAAQIRAMPKEGGVLHTGALARWRDFVEAEPAAAVLVDLARDPAAAGRVVNVCSGVPTSLAVLTQALVNAAGRPVQLREDPGRGGNSEPIRHWGSSAVLAGLGHRLAPADPGRTASALLTPETLELTSKTGSSEAQLLQAL
jgi:nucleoside-diphosphate-sugar epimerase